MDNSVGIDCGSGGVGWVKVDKGGKIGTTAIGKQWFNKKKSFFQAACINNLVLYCYLIL